MDKKKQNLGRGIERKLSGMGRRGFLKTIASLGSTTAALSGISKETYAEKVSDPRREVTRLGSYIHTNHEAVRQGAVPERKATYYTISRSQYEKVEAAHTAAKELKNENEAVTQVGVRHNLSDGAEFELRAYPKQGVELEQLEQDIPSRTEGHIENREISNIPVVARESKFGEDTYFDSKYRPVPAGCKFNYSNGYGTIGTTAHIQSPDGDTWYKGWITASHVVDWNTSAYIDQGGEGPVGRSLDATLENENETFSPDLASIISYESSGIYPALAADGCDCYSNIDVIGIVSNEQIKDLCSMEHSASIQGAKTGRSLAVTLDEFEYGPRYSTWAVFKNYPTNSGDSGGPYYKTTHHHEYGKVAKILGINRGWVDLGDGEGKRTYGNTAEFAENFLDAKI